MNGTARRRTGVGLVLALGLLATDPAQAQFDPAKAYRESQPVAARYGDPAVTYRTPAFAPGKPDFTSHEEMLAFLETLAKASPLVRLDRTGRSQEGREIPVAIVSKAPERVGSGDKPVVLIVGLQHGNEPAGGEAGLALLQLLAGGRLADLVERIDIVIAPRANPDGASAFARNLANGIDANRDHTLLRTPEGRLIASLFERFRPTVMLDCHEFTVGGRWLTKVGGLTKVDAMLQHATVPGLAPSLTAAATGRVLPAIRSALDAEGLSHDWYFTTDGSNSEAPVAMGGIGPDTGRNIAGLRNALSFLIETRGIGLGKANYARRVHTHVVAAEAIMRLVAADTAGFLALSRTAANEAASARDPLVVAARQQAQTRQLTFVDPASGADKPVSVNWLSSLEIEPVLARGRPAGYLVSAGETAAIDTLRRAGVQVRVLGAGAALAGQRYRASGLGDAAKADGRGADAGAGQIVKGVYTLEDQSVVISAGDVYVPLDQPLAGLAAVLLEPESTAGLVANRVIAASEGQLLPYARLAAAPPG
jgi:hypothetical protein